MSWLMLYHPYVLGRPYVMSGRPFDGSTLCGVDLLSLNLLGYLFWKYFIKWSSFILTSLVDYNLQGLQNNFFKNIAADLGPVKVARVKVYLRQTWNFISHAVSACSNRVIGPWCHRHIQHEFTSWCMLHTLPHDVTGWCMQLLHGLCCFHFVSDIPLLQLLWGPVLALLFKNMIGLDNFEQLWTNIVWCVLSLAIGVQYFVTSILLVWPALSN